MDRQCLASTDASGILHHHDHNRSGTTGISQWAQDAADRICNLDGIRPHLGASDVAGYMQNHIAELIMTAACGPVWRD